MFLLTCRILLTKLSYFKMYFKNSHWNNKKMFWAHARMLNSTFFDPQWHLIFSDPNISFTWPKSHSLVKRSYLVYQTPVDPHFSYFTPVISISVFRHGLEWYQIWVTTHVHPTDSRLSYLTHTQTGADALTLHLTHIPSPGVPLSVTWPISKPLVTHNAITWPTSGK